jgi:hypothetical protein
MEVYELPNNTKAATGYTHKVILTHADLTQATANTAQTVALLSVEAGDVVHSAAWKLVAPFEDSADSAFNTTSFVIGDDGSTNRFITATEANDNGSDIAYKAHTNTAPFAYTVANTIDAVVSSMAAKSLSSLDTGEVHIFFGVNKLSDL